MILYGLIEKTQNPIHHICILKILTGLLCSNRDNTLKKHLGNLFMDASILYSLSLHQLQLATYAYLVANIPFYQNRSLEQIQQLHWMKMRIFLNIERLAITFSLQGSFYRYASLNAIVIFMNYRYSQINQIYVQEYLHIATYFLLK